MRPGRSLRSFTGVDTSRAREGYHSGGATGSWQVTPLSGSIAPGAIYLVGEAAGTGGTQPLPAPQVTGTIAMSGTAGTVALVNGTAALTCSDSAACQTASVDLVGYGTAVISETAPAAGASNTDSVQRKDAADSDDNAGDFASGAPTPGATNVGGGGGGTGDGDPGPLRIHDIQDSSWLAAHNGEQVTNVPGIVTAIRTTGSSRGYWIQDPDPDSERGHQRGHLRLHLVARGGGRRLGARVGHRPRLLSAVERRLRRDDLEPVGDRDRDPDGHRALARQRAAGAEVIGPDTVPDTYAPGPQRRQHRVDADHAGPLGPGLLGVARGHARGGRRRPRGRPVQRASASSTSPPSRRRPRPTAAAPRSWPRTPSPRAASRSSPPTAPTPGSTSATCSPAPPSGRSTTRSSAAT